MTLRSRRLCNKHEPHAWHSIPCTPVKWKTSPAKPSVKATIFFCQSTKGRVHPLQDFFSGAQAAAPEDRARQQSSWSQLPTKCLDNFSSFN